MIAGTLPFHSKVSVSSAVSMPEVIAMALKTVGASILVGTIALVIVEALRPTSTLSAGSGHAEEFRGLALYALGMMHGALLSLMVYVSLKEPLNCKETVATTLPPKLIGTAIISRSIEETKSESETTKSESELTELIDDVVKPTPRTLLKGVASDPYESTGRSYVSAVRTPVVMSVDDYEMQKMSMKENSSRRRSIRTPRKVDIYSPS
ncbi:hypothetical protein AB1Y20_012075 [Prymnesium parvum]|uniref:Uncharacterized protein n=1 Tax=Prymnesium parvum TaxID=97485 RepID=A0AB34IPW8_PRYPA